MQTTAVSEQKTSEEQTTMTIFKHYISILSVVLLVGVGAVLGQTARQDASAAAAGGGNPQTVNAQQSGAWTVGIDPAKNSVKVTNEATDPLAVKVIGNAPLRKPFQFRAFVLPTTAGLTTLDVPIPAGKRLVIENISAVARTPQGIRMELRFQTSFDNDDGVGNSLDITLHRITLTDQGYFPEDQQQVATANHKVLIFADEMIDGVHFPIALQTRLTGTFAPNTVQAQVTFSGWVEDLPAVP